jgi:hypothetical protein
MTTLMELAERGGSTSRGAMALIEAGYAGETRLDELRPGSVTSKLVEVLAREIAALHERLGEVYDSAFIETETRESLERLVDRLDRPRRCWWRRGA